MAKVLQTLKTHKKKSIFFTGLFAYGVNYAKQKIDEKEMMRHYSRLAVQYGQQTIPMSTVKPYHVTVIMNPASYSGKGRSRFEKYCSPLLNLAGFKVSLIRTEGQGDAKSLMSVMSDTDAVLIAGGDGTLMEAVTGFLRRNDANTISKQVPIGILPVGFKNQMARNLFPDTKDDVKLMAECAMSVIRQHYRLVDVIEVKSQGKSIFGFREFIVGSFTDASERKEKYWYWAGLKKYVTYIFSYTTSASSVIWSIPSKIKTGINELSENVDDIAKPDTITEQPNTRASWWSYIIPTRSTSKPQENQTSQDIGHLRWSDDSISFSGCELTIESANNFPLNKVNNNLDDDSNDGTNEEVKEDTSNLPSKNELRISFGPNQIEFMDFVKEGWRRASKPIGLHVPNEWFYKNANAIFWEPDSSLISDDDSIDNEKCFYFDGESIDILGPMEISVLPEKIILFCGQEFAKDLKNSETKSSVNGGKWWQRSSGLTRRT